MTRSYLDLIHSLLKEQCVEDVKPHRQIHSETLNWWDPPVPQRWDRGLVNLTSHQLNSADPLAGPGEPVLRSFPQLWWPAPHQDEKQWQPEQTDGLLFLMSQEPTNVDMLRMPCWRSPLHSQQYYNYSGCETKVAHQTGETLLLSWE